MLGDSPTFLWRHVTYVRVAPHIALQLGADGNINTKAIDPVAYNSEGVVLGPASCLKDMMPTDKFCEELLEMRKNVAAIAANGVDWYLSRGPVPYKVTPEKHDSEEAMGTLADSVREINGRLTKVESALDKKEDTSLEAIRTSLEEQSNEIAALKNRTPIQIVLPETPSLEPVEGVRHELFEPILKRVHAGLNVFLTGPAGCGKSHMCKQIAEALGLKFYFQNAVTNTYDITGYRDAGGIYHPTEFYKAFSEGGLFLLDEIDASSPDVLTVLNAALANGCFPFPDKPEPTYQHDSFRCVAAGNTFGTGADFQYVGRTQLDAATLDRFDVVPVDYSPQIERSLLGDDMWKFAKEWRKACAKLNGCHICSTRALLDIKKLESIGVPLSCALKTRLIKEMQKHEYDELVDIVDKTMAVPAKWMRALRTLQLSFTIIA